MWKFCLPDRYDSSVSVTRLGDTRTHIQNNKSACALTRCTHAHSTNTHAHTCTGREFVVIAESKSPSSSFSATKPLHHYTRSCSCLTLGRMVWLCVCVCLSVYAYVNVNDWFYGSLGDVTVCRVCVCVCVCEKRWDEKKENGKWKQTHNKEGRVHSCLHKRDRWNHLLSMLHKPGFLT